MSIALSYSPVVIGDRRESASAAVAPSSPVAMGNFSVEQGPAVKKDGKKRVSISESVVEIAAMPVDCGGSQPPSTPSYMERQFVRLQSIHQVHIQWQLSIEKCSKLRKRQNHVPDAETPDQPQPSQTSTDNATTNEQVKTTADLPDFAEYKPSLWKKKVRSVLLRLKGQEQHKDVYVMPEHLRAQLKHMYVY